MMIQLATVLVLLATNGALGQVYDYDGNALPEEVGWIAFPHGTPEIKLEKGIYIQTFDAPGDQIFYHRSIAEFSDAPSFFAEWRVQTDVPASSLDTLQTRASLVLFGNTGVSYHFRFTDFEALFTRSDLSLLFVPITPGVLHTYRIELPDDDTYRFLVDGILVDSGAQPGAFPTVASEIAWGGRFFAPSHTVQWDYIRYGVIPEPATATLLLIGTTLLTLRRKARTH